ncbi:Fungalysin metallopeptidase-domain-containing protein [Epithele typhae]|uniref:Fungalysin metallopeptidase-domain-containing protein n=1 Tax=Epithele typhae TaxID=378194 RepID=UPI002007E66C|nr:Fungalysin metallopeptidase-domain-containing protein [Epithele typhae]KAH9911363.1 Fungalysin metallopeptidase-domain-containing protein [Epithele typhae]
MKFSNAFFRSVVLAVVCAASASAAPFASSLKHTTIQVRNISPSLVVESFHPEASLETFGEGLDHALSARDVFSIEDATAAFIQSRTGVDAESVAFRKSFSSDITQHAFVSQQFNGVPVSNAVANVAFNKDNKVVSFGSSFVKPTSVPSTTPTVSLEDAIANAESALSGKFNEHPATLEFVALKDGSLALTHVVQIQNDETGAWFEAFVDAHSGKLVQLTDFVARASYLVLPIQKEVLTEGFETLTNPQNTAASPDGWHSTGSTTTTDTDGNNAVSFKGAQTSTTQQSSATDNFVFTQNPNAAPTTQANLDAARTNAFYIVNSIHDISYIYGFTEAGFNFQTNNFGKGGTGNDRVTISVQDSAGIDNADFATPADGQSGRMRMFLWDFTSPMRDGALENDIVAHENTHGISNRMTGGGTGRCLQTTEAGGMGEGWSDAMAEWTEHKDATVPDFVLGQYVINDPAGIRSHPYSTSMTTNPLTYASLQTLTEVHDIGEVWANILHNVYAGLVGVHGFSATAKTDATTTGGNTVFLHLFLDAFTIQPCNPTFLTARNAWIQADANRFAGANFCTLWTSFASRGLGVNAANHRNDFTVPAGC